MSTSISFDGLARVDGSARFSIGSTSALASVSGPIEVRLASEHPSHATLDVLVRPLSNVPATEAKALAAIIRALLTPSLILTHNPRTLVQVVVQALSPVLGTNANVLTVALVNASTLALLNAASVPMCGVVCAVAVARRRADGMLVTGPDATSGNGKTADFDAEGCFAFMFTKDGAGEVQGKCVWTNWRAVGGGVFDEGVLGEAKEVAVVAAGEVYTAVHKSLEKRPAEENDDKMEI